MGLFERTGGNQILTGKTKSMILKPGQILNRLRAYAQINYPPLVKGGKGGFKVTILGKSP